MEKFPLTPDQQRFFELIEETNENYFINGKPGVGKSVLTRAINNEGRKTWMVAAPTGLAALNAEGQTLHRLFRLPISDGIITSDYRNWPEQKAINNIRYNVKRLLIDEISMVRADTLDYIDRLLRFAKDTDEPFGGIQVVAVGDFYQLAPVTRTAEKKQLKEEGYGSPFAFSSKVWETFSTLTLNEVLRQKGDRKFIDLLHSARTGELTAKQMVLLNERVKPRPKDLRVSLCATNAQAEAINMGRLRGLPGGPEEFEANTYGDWPAFPAEPILSLKPGAQILVKLNAADRPPDHEGLFESNVVNGTLGIVKEIVRKPLVETPNGERIKGDYVLIETDRGEEKKIYWQRWSRKVKERDGDGWYERTVASFEQIPLALAWAISMHKSQGQTFENVHIDASKIFAAGQFYVALSRCTSLKGVTLEERVNMKRIFCDPDVKKYFEQVRV